MKAEQNRKEEKEMMKRECIEKNLLKNRSQ